MPAITLCIIDASCFATGIIASFGKSLREGKKIAVNCLTARDCNMDSSDDTGFGKWQLGNKLRVYIDEMFVCTARTVWQATVISLLTRRIKWLDAQTLTVDKEINIVNVSL